MDAKLYEAVARLVTTGTGPNDDAGTTLWDWLADGDTDGRTPESLASEWDELNS